MAGLAGIELNGKVVGVSDNGIITIDSVEIASGDIVGADNGLTENAGILELGGVLNKETTIDGDGNGLFFTTLVGKDEALYFDFDAEKEIISLYATDVDKNYSGVDIDPFGGVMFYSDNNEIYFKTNVDKVLLDAVPSGDVDEAICTVGFAKSYTDNSTIVNNGLTKGRDTNEEIYLGGSLVQDTNINGSTNVFTQSHTDSFDNSITYTIGNSDEVKASTIATNGTTSNSGYEVNPFETKIFSLQDNYSTDISVNNNDVNLGYSDYTNGYLIYSGLKAYNSVINLNVNNEDTGASNGITIDLNKVVLNNQPLDVDDLEIATIKYVNNPKSVVKITSPDGSIWDLTIADDGTISATKE